MKIFEKESIQTCSLADAVYPSILKQIAKPPEALYYKGSLPKEDEFTIAVVGTRKHTHYAARVTEKLIPQLVRAGASIVSGLALGVDTLAHRATLDAGGKTYAVLGGGIDKKTLYPHTNLSLAESIIKSGGGIISEYPPEFSPTRYTFPARNRIVAGLARSVLVIEAPEKSGALITAYSALDEGRDVFAIPGDITRPESAGCNALIKRGAKPVLRVEDILEEYGMESKNTAKQALTLDKDEASVVSILGAEPTHIDEIAKRSARPIHTITGLLAVLELKGVVKNVGGMRFIRGYSG